jgi:uncharacterized membrane protein
VLNFISDFIFFSIIGYISEIIHCSLNKRKSGKALRGPWCPLYGIGGISILYITKLLPENFIIIYISGVIIASITEYITSYILEKIFNTRWWDYSNFPYNINGRICLKNSLLFGILSLILFYVYLPTKQFIYKKNNLKTFNILIITLMTIILIDAVLTILEILELKRRLEIIEEKHQNILELKKKLTKLKTNLNPNRLLKIFTPENINKTEIIKKHYKIKPKISRKK